MNKIIFLIATLSSGVAFADSWDVLVQKLTSTRVELEALSKEVDIEQKEKQAELDQWLQRKSELDSQLQREKLRELQINEKLKVLEKRVQVQNKSDPQASKKLLTWIEQYESWVHSSVPFLQEQRLETLSSLRLRLQKNREAMEFILVDFWSFVEAEFKLAQTNEYKIVDVEISGKKKKCEVARLGLMSLYVVTPDKNIYKAERESKKWVWKNIESQEQKDSVLHLVKDLREKNDSGYYFLPMEKNNNHVGASL